MHFQYLLPGMLLFITWGVMWSKAEQIKRVIPWPIAVLGHLFLGMFSIQLLFLGTGI